MDDDHKYLLEPEFLRGDPLRGDKLLVYTMAVNGRDEFREFLTSIGYPDDMAPAYRNFVRHLKEIMDTEICAKGVYARKAVFTKLRNCTDTWEIRRKHGNVNHRFYGFVVRDLAFYIVRCTDKRGEDPDSRDLEFVDRVRKDWLRQEDTRDHA